MIIEEALRFVESEEIREYWGSFETEPDLYSSCRLICNACAPLEEKAATLELIAEKYGAEAGSINIPKLAEAARTALAERYSGPDGAIFVLSERWSGYANIIRVNVFDKFDAAIGFINNETTFNEQPPPPIDDKGEWKRARTPAFNRWYEMRKLIPDSSGEFRQTIIWTLNKLGDIWYFNVNEDYEETMYLLKMVICTLSIDVEFCDDMEKTFGECDDLPKKNEAQMFQHDFCDLNLPVPFRPGDIITIDCSPFGNEFHAVITESGLDFRGGSYMANGLYIGEGGEPIDFSLNKIEKLTSDDDIIPMISPLLKAKRFSGELPEQERMLGVISKAIEMASAYEP